MAKPKRVTPKSLRVGQTVYSYDQDGEVRSHFITGNSTRRIILLSYHLGTPYFYKKAAAERYGAGPRWVWLRGGRNEFLDTQVAFRKASQGGFRYSSALQALANAAKKVALNHLPATEAVQDMRGARLGQVSIDPVDLKTIVLPVPRERKDAGRTD